MEDAARLEAKQILSQYMASDSLSSLNDVSFSEREQLAELRKQIELKKSHRDSLRSLNLGLYALKQGMCRYGNDAFEEQLAKAYHSTISQLVEKQRKATDGFQQVCDDYTLLGNSRQFLIEQAEQQKLQGVLRLQEQVRVKLASTRVVKQWEREKATLLSEQKDLLKLDLVAKEILQKHNEILERKHGEVANTLISIGEGLEKAEKLRMKLAEITKQYRDELHDDQPSDADLRSEEGKREGLVGENDRDANSSPMFDTIDWNLGSVSMDLRLDLNFKNPNDFPDILTHLSSINTNKYQLKDVKQHKPGKGVDKRNVRKTDERKNLSQKSNKQGSSNLPLSEYSSDVSTVTKKPKLNDLTEKVVQKMVSNEMENSPVQDNRQRVVVATPKPLQKQNMENMANLQHKVPRKKASMAGQHETAPNQATQKTSSGFEKIGRSTPIGAVVGQHGGKRAQEVASDSPQCRFRTPASKASGNSVSISSNPAKNKREPQATTQQQQQQRAQQEKKHVAQQKQPEQVKRTRSIKMLSPVGANQPKPVVQKPSTDNNEPTPMEVEPNDGIQDDEPSESNNSLYFGMQSGSCEFNMNFSDDLAPAPEANGDDDLDFLSMNPGRVTRSKGQKKKGGGAKGASSGDDMDMFDFTFGASNSNESLEQPEDLF